MEAIRINMPTVDRKPCVCGATLQASRATTTQHTREIWFCLNCCGARGLTYEGALRRKVRLDLLNWGDLRRNAQALIEAEDAAENEFVMQ